MASHSGESQDPRYDRDAINISSNDEHNKPGRVVHLSRFINDQTPAQAIQQTADYARQPRIYLESTLGNKVLTDREELLCIPDIVDRDYYGVGDHKKHFEQHIAKLFGKEHSLFFITGVQAQLAAMKIHSDRAGKSHFGVLPMWGDWCVLLQPDIRCASPEDMEITTQY